MQANTRPPTSVWNRVPSVATGRPSVQATAAAAVSATSGAGTMRVRRGTSNSRASVSPATISSTGVAVPRAAHSAATFSGKATGMWVTTSPSASFS
jgi:hypothetical protein